VRGDGDLAFGGRPRFFCALGVCFSFLLVYFLFSRGASTISSAINESSSSDDSSDRELQIEVKFVKFHSKYDVMLNYQPEISSSECRLNF